MIMFVLFTLLGLLRGTIGHAPAPPAPVSVSTVTRACGCQDHTAGAVLATSIPAAALSRRRRRVLIYCRFSTDQQLQESLADQEAKCRRHLRSLDLEDSEITVVADAAISGELAHRPGIDKVYAAIETHACDVIVVEEMSRIYRLPTCAMALIEAAVDAGIRVIGINDSVDTKRDDWRLNGHFASIKAELDNTQTRRRIARSIEARWERGEVVSSTIYPGYFRVPVHVAGVDPSTLERHPDTTRKSGGQYRQLRGPFIEKLDARWTPVIRRGYEMCASGEPNWVIAKYFNQAGMPRSSLAKSDEWSQEYVAHLIREPLYGGTEEFRHTHGRQRYRSGATERVPTPPEEIWRREMPHLAHVEMWLWQRANDALAARCAGKDFKCHDRSALRGVPRDRRGPLSKHLSCGICGALMYRDFAYRCSNSRWSAALRRKFGHRCWVRAMPRAATVHANIGRAITDAITAQAGALTALYDEVVRLVRAGDPTIEQRMNRLRQKEAELDRACKKLGDALEKAGDIDDIVTRLRARNDERQRLRLELERLSTQTQSTITPPTFEEFETLLAKVKELLLGDFGRDIGPLLRRLTSPIQAMPYRPFDRDGVVLRAHFDIYLIELLPDNVRQLLQDTFDPAASSSFRASHTIPLIVDLFKRPKRYVHAKAIYDLVQTGLTLREAGRRVGMPETTAQRALQTGITMAAQGLADPYIRLDAMPKRPGRWRPQVDRPDVFDE